MRRLLKKLFDVEAAPHGWDVRLWPTNWRMYLRNVHGEKRLGIYQLRTDKCSCEFSWWIP